MKHLLIPRAFFCQCSTHLHLYVHKSRTVPPIITNYDITTKHIIVYHCYCAIGRRGRGRSVHIMFTIRMHAIINYYNDITRFEPWALEWSTPHREYVIQRTVCHYLTGAAYFNIMLAVHVTCCGIVIRIYVQTTRLPHDNRMIAN